jgi:hypothetical protein
MRRALATVIILAWGVALGGLVRRDVIRSATERLAEIGMRVTPANVFYGLARSGAQAGWASSTLDTASLGDTLSLRDEMVLDSPDARDAVRITVRSQVMMSRAFLLRTFLYATDSAGTSTRIAGRAIGDSGVLFALERDGVASDSQFAGAAGPVLVPEMLPIATILSARPRAGRSMTFSVFDPSARTIRDVTSRILAESLFVVDDTARMDAVTGRWVSALSDTVRAWRVSIGDSAGGDWYDGQGRTLHGTRFGDVSMRRMAYEMSFENWRLARRGGSDSTSDLVTSTIVAAGVTPPAGPRALTVTIQAPSLAPFHLDGGRQSLRANELRIEVEHDSLFRADYTLPPDVAHRARFRDHLAAEPFLQTRITPILRQAVTIIRLEREPARMVQHLVRWVADSVTRSQSTGTPDALRTLRARTGDVLEHAMVFTALARSVDIPARIVYGLLLAGDRFHYHVWTEVHLGDWVAVDPTLGQFPADAGHIRLMTGGLPRQADLLRRLPTLHIDVTERR